MRCINKPKVALSQRRRLLPCTSIGMLLIPLALSSCDMTPPPVQKTETELQQACRGLQAEACRTLANLSWQGVFLSRDRKRAQRLWSFACHLGDGQACALRQRELLHGHSYATDTSPPPHPNP
jgi:hypothetical protein